MDQLGELSSKLGRACVVITSMSVDRRLETEEVAGVIYNKVIRADRTSHQRAFGYDPIAELDLELDAHHLSNLRNVDVM
eukprot:1376920-Amorphochlora_amoeboformis.AAC.2